MAHLRRLLLVVKPALGRRPEPALQVRRVHEAVPHQRHDAAGPEAAIRDERRDGRPREALDRDPVAREAAGAEEVELQGLPRARLGAASGRGWRGALHVVGGDEPRRRRGRGAEAAARGVGEGEPFAEHVDAGAPCRLRVVGGDGHDGEEIDLYHAQRVPHVHQRVHPAVRPHVQSLDDLRHALDRARGAGDRHVLEPRRPRDLQRRHAPLVERRGRVRVRGGGAGVSAVRGRREGGLGGAHETDLEWGCVEGHCCDERRLVLAVIRHRDAVGGHDAGRCGAGGAHDLDFDEVDHLIPRQRGVHVVPGGGHPHDFAAEVAPQRIAQAERGRAVGVPGLGAGCLEDGGRRAQAAGGVDGAHRDLPVPVLVPPEDQRRGARDLQQVHDVHEPRDVEAVRGRGPGARVQRADEALHRPGERAEQAPLGLGACGDLQRRRDPRRQHRAPALTPARCRRRPLQCARGSLVLRGKSRPPRTALYRTALRRVACAEKGPVWRSRTRPRRPLRPRTAVAGGNDGPLRQRLGDDDDAVRRGLQLRQKRARRGSEGSGRWRLPWRTGEGLPRLAARAIAWDRPGPQ